MMLNPLKTLALLITAAASVNGQPAPASYAQPAGAPEPRPLFRHASIDAAWQAAQKSGRPVLVYVTSKQCHFCEKMARETWSHPQIAAAVAQRFEPVAVLKENDPALTKRLGVRAYPTTVVVTPKGELANQVRGFADPRKFASLILSPKRVGQAQATPVGHGNGRR